MALATLSDLEAWLELPSGNADEALLTRLLGAASDFVETWCSRRFAVAAYTDVRDGSGQARMTMSCRPVVSVAALAIDGAAIPAAGSITGSGWFLNGDTVQLFGYVFNRGQANVMISYSAGFATIPAAVAQAVIELAAMRYRERSRTGMASVAAAGETTSFVIRDMPPAVATLLGQYRMVVPA
jgi:hypothetical protein